MPRFFRLPLFAASFLLACAPGSAFADEASVRKAVEAFFAAPVPVVDSVIRIPQGGLYEVVLINGQLFYTDETVGFIVDGRIVDTKTRRDLTEARLAKLSAVDFKTLPLDQAIKRVNGNGKRVIATFEDPNCTYCKKLGQELQKVKDVTIYTFLVPILAQDSDIKSRDIWCAKDKSAAWLDWIISGKTPAEAKCDAAAIDRNVELAKKLRISGTPTLFLTDGTRLGGYRDAGDLEQALKEAVAKTGKK